MRDGLDKPANLHFDAEFLHQLAMQRLFEGFARFTLPAGEFPQSGEMPASRTLGDEEFAVPKDQSCADLDDLPC